MNCYLCKQTLQKRISQFIFVISDGEDYKENAAKVM